MTEALSAANKGEEASTKARMRMVVEPRRLGTFRLLDTWRGIAALGIVFYHWSGIVARPRPELLHDPFYRLCEFGAFGVPIFFVISGFCIANAALGTLWRGQSVSDFLKARARRISPTYWAALVLTLFATYIQFKMRIGTEISDPLNVPLSSYVIDLSLFNAPLLKPPALIVAWSLSYEVLFYGLVAIALAIAATRKSTPLILPLLHTLTVCCLVGNIFWPYHSLAPFNLWPHFGLGVLVYDILSHPTRKSPKIWFAATLLLYAVFLVRFDTVIGFLPQAARPTFALAAIFAIYLLIAYPYDERWSRPFVARGLTAIGLFSYSLYLTHMTALRVFNQVALKLHLPTTLHLILFVGAVLFALAFAYGFFLLCERPFVRSGSSGAQQGAGLGDKLEKISGKANTASAMGEAASTTGATV